MTDTNQLSRVSMKYFLKTLLIVTFPLHVWALLMIFRDLEFVSERTEIWDAVGYAGYSLMFTLIESLILALVVWLLSLLLPKKWDTQRSLNIAGSIFLILAGASIVDMAFHAFADVRISRQYLHGLETYPTLTYFLIAGTVILSIFGVVWLILKSARTEQIFTEIYDRIMLLSYFYLFLDVAGIAIVILRNLSETL